MYTGSHVVTVIFKANLSTGKHRLQWISCLYLMGIQVAVLLI